MQFSMKPYATVIMAAIPNLFDSWAEKPWGCTYLFNGYMVGAVVVDQEQECLWDAQDINEEEFDRMTDAERLDWCRENLNSFNDAMGLAANKVMTLTQEPGFDWDGWFGSKVD